MSGISMTTRERIIAAIKHEAVDRIPISPRINPQNYGYGTASVHAMVNCGRQYHYDPPIPCGYPADLTIFKRVMAEAAYTQDVNTVISIKDEGDTLRVTCVFETPAGKLQQVKVRPKVGQTKYGTSPNPHIAEFLIKDGKDLEKMRYLLPSEQTFSLGDYFELEKMYWNNAVVMPSICGPFSHTGGNFCDMCTLMIAYYEDRGFFDEYMKIFSEFSLAQLRWCLERGIKHFFLVWFYESLSSGWSPQIYREVFAPELRKQVDLIHAADGIACFYDDGKLLEALPYITETGVDCIETCTPAPMGDFDIAEAKSLYGSQVAFKGGIDIVNVIWQGTPELIDQTVYEYMKTGSAGSGFLIGTCDTIRPETPKQNTDAFFIAANKYAKEFACLTK
ncbi:MAG: uroporphyrinogen decarboxylase family protein [Victivallaceae bacterium]|nr:uroporphyrinogen decarboxylase family protein [Victivallaceae bacterium]